MAGVGAVLETAKEVEAVLGTAKTATTPGEFAAGGTKRLKITPGKEALERLKRY